MKDIKLGYHYNAKPMFTALANQIGGVAHNGANAVKPRTTVGKCVFIHPRGRFVTLEFSVRGGIIRECFRPDEVR